jgi:hypothetical protein
MRVSVRPLLGVLLVLLLLAGFNQASVIADAGAGPLPPIPDDSIPSIESDSPPENPDDGLGLVETILIIILPML